MHPTVSSLRRHRGFAMFLALAAGLLTLAIYFAPGLTLLDRLEWRTVDWRFGVRGPIPPQPDVAIVAVDEDAMKLGRWPWPRDRFARVVDALRAAGASQVVFDVFFLDPDASPGGAQRDDELAAAVRRAGNVYLATAGLLDERKGVTGQDGPALPTWDVVLAAARERGGPAPALFAMPGLTAPLPRLAQAARGLGFVDVAATDDGVFRHAVPFAMVGGHLYPSLPLAVAADRIGVGAPQVSVSEAGLVRLGEARAIPIDPGGMALINFAGPRGTYPRRSIATLLDPATKSDPDSFRGKTVLIGVTAQGINDLRASPYGAVFDGVETQANILGNILADQFLRRVPAPLTAAVTLAMMLLLGFAFPRLRIPVGAPLIVVVIVAYDVAAVWAFSHSRLVLDLATPNVAWLGATVALLTYRIAVEEQERHRAQTALRRFVPPEVARTLVEGEAEATMLGERREITVLFADIRDFTAASERIAPEASVELLNRYFRLMDETIWEFGGTLDKYMGDGLMAFFNAPKRQADHAQLAVMTAIEMQRRILANRAEWSYYGMPDLRIGIGIATGPAVVGWVGSSERNQYTVIGSHVNLAARLEELTKQYGEPIIIAREVFERVHDFFDARRVASVDVKGFSQKVPIYAVEVPELVAAARAAAREPAEFD